MNYIDTTTPGDSISVACAKLNQNYAAFGVAQNGWPDLGVRLNFVEKITAVSEEVFVTANANEYINPIRFKILPAANATLTEKVVIDGNSYFPRSTQAVVSGTMILPTCGPTTLREGGEYRLQNVPVGSFVQLIFLQGPATGRLIETYNMVSGENIVHTATERGIYHRVLNGGSFNSVTFALWNYAVGTATIQFWRRPFGGSKQFLGPTYALVGAVTPRNADRNMTLSVVLDVGDQIGFDSNLAGPIYLQGVLTRERA